MDHNPPYTVSSLFTFNVIYAIDPIKDLIEGVTKTLGQSSRLGRDRKKTNGLEWPKTDADG